MDGMNGGKCDGWDEWRELKEELMDGTDERRIGI